MENAADKGSLPGQPLRVNYDSGYFPMGVA